MNDQIKQSENVVIAWGHEFMYAWAELVNGALDIHDTLDWAYELWPTMGHRNPAEVAKEYFDRQDAV